MSTMYEYVLRGNVCDHDIYLYVKHYNVYILNSVSVYYCFFILKST